MKKLVIAFLASLGALVLLALIGAAVVGLLRFWRAGAVPERTILEVDLETAPVEHVPEDPLASLVLRDRLTMRDLVEAVERGGRDERVVGLVARLGANGMGLAQIQELRDEIRSFRESGKFAFAYAETFGEVAPGNGAYYLATAFDQIFLMPSGDVGLTGFIAETPFVRGTLDKLGVIPRGDHRYEYKSALNTFTERALTEAHRQELAAVVDSMFSQMVRGIAEGRGLSVDVVRSIIDRGPLLGTEALEAGLVDALAYRDEVYGTAHEKGGDGSELLYLRHYFDRAGSPHDRGRVVALIHGVGPVTRGESELDPLSGGSTMGADTVARAFRAAIDDDEVEAILFRVDSPGGSYVASDAIWRETIRAREAGKPVVVSMGNLAGSGGYFVAMAAAKIVAEPATITGSIGVLNVKMLTRDFWNALGVTWDHVQRGEHADYYSGLHDFSPEEWNHFQEWLDRIYADFTRKVAEGRGLPLERVLEIAKGRIWSGEDARSLGLVDELGGVHRALALAREEAGIPPDAPVELRPFPRPRSPLEMLIEGRPKSSEEATAAALRRTWELARPLGRWAGELLLSPADQVLAMPRPAQLPWDSSR